MHFSQFEGFKFFKSLRKSTSKYPVAAGWIEDTILAIFLITPPSHFCQECKFCAILISGNIGFPRLPLRGAGGAGGLGGVLGKKFRPIRTDFGFYWCKMTARVGLGRSQRQTIDFGPGLKVLGEKVNKKFKFSEKSKVLPPNTHGFRIWAMHRNREGRFG